MMTIIANIYRTFPYCKTQVEWLVEWLKETFPRAQIDRTQGTLYSDFAKLVFTKTLFVEAGTFGLFGALACTGTVYLPPVSQMIATTYVSPLSDSNDHLSEEHKKSINHMLPVYYPILPPNYHVIATTLLPETIALERMGFDPNHAETFEIAKKWLLTH